MSEELKPCPCCRKAPRVKSGGPGCRWVQCECGLETIDGDLDRVISIWNRRADDWRDIESAPRDGTPVLLFRDGEVFVARWTNSEEMGPVWATPDGHVVFRATHWKPLGPLPTPPEGE